VPHFSGSASGAPADFTATLKTFAIEEAHALVNAGPRLVDGFPQITARYATRDEAAAAQAVLTMVVRAKEAEAKEAMDAADVRAGIAPSKDGGSAAAVVTDPLEKSKGDLASYRTELNLLSALGAAADAERKLAVLKAMQALLATIKELEAAKASAPAGAAAAAATKGTYSSSEDNVDNASALLYITGFDKPVHDERLLALLSVLFVNPKHIWRAEGSTDICVECAAAFEAARLVDQFLYPTFGSFLGLNFSRRRPAPAAAAAAAHAPAPRTGNQPQPPALATETAPEETASDAAPLDPAEPVGGESDAAGPQASSEAAPTPAEPTEPAPPADVAA
jgi:hypothetical protein